MKWVDRQAGLAGSQERSFKDLAKVVLNLSDGGLKALTDSGKWAEGHMRKTMKKAPRKAMSKIKSYKSKVHAAIHETASDLFELDLIDKKWI